MKKVSSPVEIYRVFKDGTMIKIPANGEVVCDDEKAAEIKSIYPFVRTEEVVEEKVEEEIVKQEEETEEKKEQAKEQEKKPKKERKSKN